MPGKPRLVLPNLCIAQVRQVKAASEGQQNRAFKRLTMANDESFIAIAKNLVGLLNSRDKREPP
ncbi:hypothetical protein ACPOL_2266 [Acidisarcina polymorpha]|uniref:Uncharacterized protein n=1 Tax=Acidisarcina polymorpha TaxID=2211140 RepID=A0A2Z5FXY7_9BACT|nr:hypothetical protein ACPOL_2266 [Acidisarcina polymorpha]